MLFGYPVVLSRDWRGQIPPLRMHSRVQATVGGRTRSRTNNTIQVVPLDLSLTQCLINALARSAASAPALSMRG